MFTSAFAKATAERAVRTFVQALLAVFAADEVFNVLSVDWVGTLSTAASATVLSVLTSLVASNFGNRGPSLANETLTTDRVDTTGTTYRR